MLTKKLTLSLISLTVLVVMVSVAVSGCKDTASPEDQAKANISEVQKKASSAAPKDHPAH